MENIQWVELLCLLPPEKREEAERFMVLGWEAHFVAVLANAVWSQVQDCARFSGEQEYFHFDVHFAMRDAMQGDFETLQEMMHDLDMGD